MPATFTSRYPRVVEVTSDIAALIAAFHAARKSGGGDQTGSKADYIEKGEFRMLFVML